MEFICQKNAMKSLASLAHDDKHSILVEGIQGCGKTHFSRVYAELIKSEDYQIVQPKVAELKECMEQCLQLNTTIVICIENLDTGQLSAAYSILKFLEEPQSNVYIIVTCRNMQRVPDTIISRCATISIAPPTDVDLRNYSISVNENKYNQLVHNKIFKCARTFSDIDIILNMKPEHLEYFSSLSQISKYNDSVTNLVWKLGHYPDNTETPIELVIRYLVELTPTKHIQLAGIECINSLVQRNIATHAVLAKFVFECKYCE